MKILRIIVITVACVLFAGVAAEAADLFSPPLFPAINQFVACQIANVSGRIRTVQWELLSDAGLVAASGGPFNVDPGQAVGGYLVIDGAHYGANYYCHFVVQGTNTSQYRAAIKLSNLNNGGGDLLALSAD